VGGENELTSKPTSKKKKKKREIMKKQVEGEPERGKKRKGIHQFSLCDERGGKKGKNKEVR